MNFFMKKLFVLIAFFSFCSLACPVGIGLAADPDAVSVFAAASMTNAINDIGKVFAEQGLGKTTPSFASSSTLAKQIENGAPANVFISADVQWMDYLADRKLIESDTRFDLAGNRLVLVAPTDNSISLEIRPGFALAAALRDGRLAVGDPDHVPAGIYAKAALVKLGVWKDVESRLARSADVRAALALVERGEVPLGIVYSTDAAISKKVRVVAVFPPDTHPPVLYPVAIVAGHSSPAAKRFVTFLKGPAAEDIFKHYGFTRAEPGSK